jgi:Na+-transporting methylmalonyl-CoA/oxaloacetate decarboxylase gamma subunit
MWLLGFGIVLQILVILELALNRVIAVVSNSRRNPVRKWADGSV